MMSDICILNVYTCKLFKNYKKNFKKLHKALMDTFHLSTCKANFSVSLVKEPVKDYGKTD